MADLSEDVAAIRTDIRWIKEMLTKMDNKIDSNNEELREMMDKFREEYDKKLEKIEGRVDELDERVDKVERSWSWLWGAIATLGAITSILAVMQYFGWI